MGREFRVAVLTVSDTAALDASQDRSGPIIIEFLREHSKDGDVLQVHDTAIVADDVDAIRQKIRAWVESGSYAWVITTGGTGFGSRDVTPEAVSALVTKPAPGLVHLLLSSSLEKTPLAALSRPVAGVVEIAGSSALVTTLPGSPKAVRENLAALLGHGIVSHALDLLSGGSGCEVHRHLGLPERVAGGSAGGIPAEEHISRLGSGHSHSYNTHGDHHHHHHHHHDHSDSHAHGHSIPEPKSHDPTLGARARHRTSPFALKSFDEAISLVRQNVHRLETITLPVSPDLKGHVLAEDVTATTDIPLSPTTNVDGYAIDASLPPGKYPVLTPQTFSLRSNAPLPKGHIYRINTGSPLPVGTNAVVMVEDTLLVETRQSQASESSDVGDELEVELLVGAEPFENVRRAGSDVREHDLVLPAGTKISALGGEIGTLAFVGRRHVKVYRKPRVGIMSTGNEVVDLQDSSSAQRVDSGRDGWAGTFDTNRPSLSAALEGMGYEVIDAGIVDDTLESHTETMRSVLQKCDILLTTGGSSMGSSDLLKPVIERQLRGTIHFGRVALKPGKPTTFATVPSGTTDYRSSKSIFALPGNPASALVMFYVFVVPALRLIGGWSVEDSELPRIKAQLVSNMPLDSRPEFHRVRLKVSLNTVKAFSTGGQRSSRIASLAGANGLVALPSKDSPEAKGRTEISAGQTVDALLIGELESL